MSARSISPTNLSALSRTTPQFSGPYLSLAEGYLAHYRTEDGSTSRRLYVERLQDFADSGVALAQIKEAMYQIGYNKHALHQLDRWESKRTTGRFGR
ncbi:hypothetical protein Prum_091480 [Phytohabitans rumicis]|uniref:Uncharacterized protein n=1 Tax=Phytohabitans rumicis TaxID=1076125 RepID=A0A6V8LMV7_9ACTN|nr:hypothetical protein Prum_091480 [Phytohabitans rumicis]